MVRIGRPERPRARAPHRERVQPNRPADPARSLDGVEDLEQRRQLRLQLQLQLQDLLQMVVQVVPVVVRSSLKLMTRVSLSSKRT